MVRLFRASDLPPDVAGMIITDGDDVALLINGNFVEANGPAWTREVANSLLSRLKENDGGAALRVAG